MDKRNPGCITRQTSNNSKTSIWFDVGFQVPGQIAPIIQRDSNDLTLAWLIQHSGERTQQHIFTATVWQLQIKSLEEIKRECIDPNSPPKVT